MWRTIFLFLEEELNRREIEWRIIFISFENLFLMYGAFRMIKKEKIVFSYLDLNFILII